MSSILSGDSLNHNLTFPLNHQYKGVIDAGIRTFATYGTRGLYRGIFITICRDIPSFAAYFCMLSFYIASFIYCLMHPMSLDWNTFLVKTQYLSLNYLP